MNLPASASFDPDALFAPVPFTSYAGLKMTGQWEPGWLLKNTLPRGGGAVLADPAGGSGLVAIGPDVKQGGGDSRQRVEAYVAYERIAGAVTSADLEPCGLFAGARTSGAASDSNSGWHVADGATYGSWVLYLSPLTGGEFQLIIGKWSSSGFVALPGGTTPVLKQTKGTLYKTFGMAFEVEGASAPQTFRAYLRNIEYLSPVDASAGGSGFQDPSGSFGQTGVVNGYKPVALSGWTKVIEITSTGDPVNYRERVGLFGPPPTTVGSKQFALRVERVLVRDGSSGIVRFDDTFVRADGLCAERASQPLIGDTLDYGTLWSADDGGRNQQLSGGAVGQQAGTPAEGVFRLQGAAAVPFCVSQRPADDPKSQRRELEFSVTAQNPAVGIALRGTLNIPEDQAPTATWPGFDGYAAVAQTGSFFQAIQLLRFVGGVPVQLATAPATLNASTRYVLELSVHDLVEEADAAVVLTAKLDGATLTWTVDSSATEVFDIGSGRILDNSAARITSGTREALYIVNSSEVVDAYRWTQLALQGPGAGVQGDVASISVAGEEDAASGELDVNVQWAIQRVARGPAVQSRMTSGRRRSLAVDDDVREVWMFTGQLDATQLAALETFFEERGSETPFTWRPGEYVDDPLLTAGYFRWVRGSLDWQRLRSRPGDYRYEVTFRLIRLRGTP